MPDGSKYNLDRKGRDVAKAYLPDISHKDFVETYFNNLFNK